MSWLVTPPFTTVVVFGSGYSARKGAILGLITVFEGTSGQAAGVITAPPGPWHPAAGTTRFCATLWFSFKPSYVAKKKVLSFLIGPPNAPPYWFFCSNGFGCPAVVKKKFLASSEEL